MSPDIDTLHTRQHGVVHVRQLVEGGCDPDAASSLGHHGGWTDIGHGVFRRTDAPQTLHQRLMAAVLQTGKHAVVAGPSAAWTWGLSAHSAYAPIHVFTARTAPMCSPRGVKVQRGSAIAKRWLTTLDAIPVVRPELVAISLLIKATPSSARRVAREVDQLWSKRYLSPASIGACLDDIGTRGRRGVEMVRRYLNERADQPLPAISPLERRLMSVASDCAWRVERVHDHADELPSGRIEVRFTDTPILVAVRSRTAADALTDPPSETLRQRRLATDGVLCLELSDQIVWKRPRYVEERVDLHRFAARSLSLT